VHLGQPEQAQREDLQVGVAAAPRDRHGALGERGALPDVDAVPGAFDGDPAATVAVGPVGGAVGAGEPAAGGRRAAREQVLVGDPDADAGGDVAPPGPRVRLEGLLPHADAVLDVPEEPQREAQTVAGVGGVGRREAVLEHLPGRVPLRGLQQAQPVRGGTAHGGGVHGRILPLDVRYGEHRPDPFTGPVGVSAGGAAGEPPPAARR
jgi:hypothetical protein